MKKKNKTKQKPKPRMRERDDKTLALLVWSQFHDALRLYR